MTVAPNYLSAFELAERASSLGIDETVRLLEFVEVRSQLVVRHRPKIADPKFVANGTQRAHRNADDRQHAFATL
jgi:hypothetical protein